MRRRDVLRAISLAGGAAGLGGRGGAATPTRRQGDEWGTGSVAGGDDGMAQRAYWLEMMDRVCRPVLSGAAAGRLRATMPVEAAAGHEADRRKVTHLEAVGRTLAGIAPWLEHGPRDGSEGRLRQQYAEWARAAIGNGVRKGGPDYLNWGEDRQTIVDAAFLALGLARAPQELREALSAEVRKDLAAGMRATRELTPPFNNWLLFAAMVEVCLYQLGETFDRLRIDYALRELAAWYLGDGTYGDGPQFHADYYNSFVMHPFLLAILDSVGGLEPAWGAMRTEVSARARRYAALQERMISPEGTYPVVGRSIAYRCGAFHLLSDVTLREMLPEGLTGAQVRCALTAVMRKTLGAAGTFDAQEWLRIGLAGHQPGLGETYISTGSLYLCTAVFLPLGLPKGAEFWSGAGAAWTSQRVWGGEDMRADHAM